MCTLEWLLPSVQSSRGLEPRKAPRLVCLRGDVSARWSARCAAHPPSRRSAAEGAGSPRGEPSLEPIFVCQKMWGLPEALI